MGTNGQNVLAEADKSDSHNMNQDTLLYDVEGLHPCQGGRLNCYEIVTKTSGVVLKLRNAKAC